METMRPKPRNAIHGYSFAVSSFVFKETREREKQVVIAVGNATTLLVLLTALTLIAQSTRTEWKEKFIRVNEFYTPI